MKIKTALLFILLLLAGSGGAHAASYVVQDVEDGDTLVLEMNGKSVRVQLLGIDAPEDSDNPKFKLDLEKTGIEQDQLRQLGVAATEHLKTLVVVGESVSLPDELRDKDRYGRVPAIVSNSAGRNLSDAMVQDGYAIAVMRTGEDDAYIRRLDRLERFSRKSNNGLWGSHPELVRNWYDRTR